MPPRLLQGRCVVAGAAAGRALVSAQPISLWGGLDPRTGEIIDRRHDRSGQIVIGRVLLFPHGRGSSTGSAILLEAIRAGTAPAAIVNLATDPIAALGAIVADELYGRTMPIVVLAEPDFASIRDGDHVTIAPDGTVRVEPAEGA
jgi:predicted aconitase with swiveling domain